MPLYLDIHSFDDGAAADDVAKAPWRTCRRGASTRSGTCGTGWTSSGARCSAWLRRCPPRRPRPGTMRPMAWSHRGVAFVAIAIGRHRWSVGNAAATDAAEFTGTPGHGSTPGHDGKEGRGSHGGG